MKKQINKNSTYWPRLSTEINGYIDWNMSTSNIIKFINAFDDPYEGCKTFLNKKVVYFKSVEIYKIEKNYHPFQKGLVFRINEKGIFIAANQMNFFSEETKIPCKNIVELTDDKGRIIEFDCFND